MTETTTDVDDQPVLDLKTVRPPKRVKVKAATDDEKARIAGDVTSFTVPFGRIKIAGDNVRGADQVEIEQLAESIRQRGLLTPIGVRRGSDGSFVLEVGKRRWLALHSLKLKADDPVPVHILTATDMINRIGRQWAENVHRLQLTPLDEARTIRRLVEVHEMTQAAAAEYLGINRTVASKRLNLLHLPDDAQALVETHQWDIDAAQIAGSMIRSGDVDAADVVGLHRNHLESKRDRIRERKTMASLHSNLEARGFVVITDVRNGPAPDGHATQSAGTLDLTTVKAIKAVDVDQVETVRDADGRPVVCLRSTAAGPVVYAIETYDRGDVAGDRVDGVADYDRRHLARTKAAERLRNDRINVAGALLARSGARGLIDLPAVGPARVLRSLLQAFGNRFFAADLQAVAEAGGVDVIRRKDRGDVDHRATLQAWAADENVTAEQAMVMVYALLAQSCAYAIGDLDGDVDGMNDVVDNLAWLGVAFGMDPPLPPDEWAALVDPDSGDDQ